MLTLLHDERNRRRLVLAVALLCAAVLAGANAVRLDKGLRTLQEARMFDGDDAHTIRGSWTQWTQNTIDHEKSIHTGFFYNTTTLLGAALTPFLGDREYTMGTAARTNALLQGAATIVLATVALGVVSGWSLWAVLVPLFLLGNMHFNYLSAVARVDISMFLWLAVVPWAYTRLWLAPGKPAYKWAVITTTFAFAAKPAILPLFLFFIGLNALQVLRDGQPFLRELRWRFVKGLKYFLATMLVATPVTVLSFGLFVSSLRSELRKTSAKFDFRPFTDWFDFLLSGHYFGAPLLAVSALVVAAFLVVRWWPPARRGAPAQAFGRGQQAAARDPLPVFLWINLLWTLCIWGFVILRSRSFIDRYLNPGLLPAVFAVVAAVIWLSRQRGRGRWPLGHAAGIGVLVVLLWAAPTNVERVQWLRQQALAKQEAVVPMRAFLAEFEALVPFDESVLFSTHAYVELERYPVSHLFWDLQPRHFDIEPAYLLLAGHPLRGRQMFLRLTDMSKRSHLRRKMTAVIFREIEQSRLFGSLELVKHWPEQDVFLFRFTRPTDQAYVDWLFGWVAEQLDVPLQQLKDF